ncbi:MAG: Metal dependent phosphohydrolase [Candidatus Curtissbacteria bacterium GW2011_GWA1_40_16]|uniref:Metal dependent phosphohydrolase n=1 Tax=Candidatus Curtissbacteria bacterium GW2011_GWA1_40_16 TaxID=1618405 RepID=A0A0G0RN89_9BACT|nr:MAG: Metal dependent phosphohydrolase [Candidatus Curtissbacteria bacterium GW2011_GWA1_40_16]
MTKDDALKILDKLENSRNMANHGKAAGFAMVALYDFFKSKNQNPELSKNDWEIVGLLHDADYEKTNKSLDLHTEETTKLLNQINADQIITNAIRGHCDKEPRNTLVAKSIYAVDELTGLIVACALVQPDKKLKSVTLGSVLRKFKEKSFAAGANRDQIKTCEAELNIPLDEFTSLTLKSMQEQSEDLGL